MKWHMFVFGHSSPKPQVGYTNAPWASEFNRIASSKFHNMSTPSSRLTFRCKRGRFNGLHRRTKASSAYPAEFVQTLARLNAGLFRQGGDRSDTD